MTSFAIAMSELTTVLPSLRIDGLIDKPISITKLLEVVELATKPRSSKLKTR
jgi:hypothetical protein